jgi:hypothetical protein
LKTSCKWHLSLPIAAQSTVGFATGHALIRHAKLGRGSARKSLQIAVF